MRGKRAPTAARSGKSEKTERKDATRRTETQTQTEPDARARIENAGDAASVCRWEATTGRLKLQLRPLAALAELQQQHRRK